MERFKIGERLRQRLDSFRSEREKKKFNKSMGYIDYEQYKELMWICRNVRSKLKNAYESSSNNKDSSGFLDREKWVDDIIEFFNGEGLDKSCFSCLWIV